MKRFAFRLARVERVRLAEKREARAALALAVAEATARRAERERAELASREADAATLPPELAALPRAWRELALFRIERRRLADEARSREAAAYETVREAERVHAEAARAHRVLERLHERRKMKWLEAATLEEQKFLDEMHLLRLSRAPQGPPEEV